MKNKSIATQIFLVFIIFTISIFVLIGLFTKLFLPDYYVNKKIQEIDGYIISIRTAYDNNQVEQVTDLFEQLKNDVGGDLYLVDNAGNMKGTGKYKQGQGSIAYYDLTNNLFESHFTNKYGIEIVAFGAKIEDEYLVHEVSIQSLEEAVNTMMEFILWLLILSIAIAVVGAYVISINITKPIKQLNNLAKQMKEKQVQSLEVSKRSDEIGELNQSMNLLYEELLSNIQRLETELTKERAVEKLKKQFLAQATHELKTPLAIIQGYAELLDDHIYENQAEQNYFIKNIYNETEKMNKLMSDILDYSKIESGFFTINKASVFVNPWLNHITATFKTIIENKGLIFVVSNQVGDLCVNMDAFRVEQVVTNLLTNAIEHTSGKITLNAYNLNEQLVIEVINTGRPIDEQDLPFIFDSFYKKKGKKAGTGLGLAIVKGIVELHHGDYRVENMDDGVKFSIII